MARKCYSKPNNPRAADYDPRSRTSTSHTWTRTTWAMSLPLRKEGFKWKQGMAPKDQIMKLKETSSRVRWILEVDLEYLEELHESHNSYPLEPEKKAIGEDQMSNYQKRMMENLGLDFPKSEKLVLTLKDKEKYIVYYRNQFYFKQGMRLKKVHRVLEFNQERWMEP